MRICFNNISSLQLFSACSAVLVVLSCVDMSEAWKKIHLPRYYIPNYRHIIH